MPLEKTGIQKFEDFIDRLTILRYFFTLPFTILHRFFRGKKYYDF